MITISGGEPLLHPELDEIIARIRRRWNYRRDDHQRIFSDAERIERLNRAGLEYLQISIDNVTPDEVSKKSLKTLDEKLSCCLVRRVSGEHQFGAGQRRDNPEDALKIGASRGGAGIHEHRGDHSRRQWAAEAAGRARAEIFEEIMELGKRSFSRLNDFQHNMARGRENNWRCRSGSRYLYICEDGLVHWCSQQRGYPGIPLAEYTRGEAPPGILRRKSSARRIARFRASTRYRWSMDGEIRRVWSQITPLP